MVKFTVTKKDLDISYFSKGKGGQKINKTNPFVRIHHKESGATATGQEYRERGRNLKLAMKNLTHHFKFKYWATQKLKEIEEGKSIEEAVEEQMRPENLEITDAHGNPI